VIGIRDVIDVDLFQLARSPWSWMIKVVFSVTARFQGSIWDIEIVGSRSWMSALILFAFEVRKDWMLENVASSIKSCVAPFRVPLKKSSFREVSGSGMYVPVSRISLLNRKTVR